MLGTSYLGYGIFDAGNVETLTGISGTITDGYGFDYPYTTPPDFYVDSLGATEGVIILVSQDGKGRAVAYDNTSDTGAGYRTITSSTLFTAYLETSTTRQELMTAYRDFLMSGLGIEEDLDPDPGVSPSLVTVSPVRGYFTANLVLPRALGVELAIFDLSGRMVATLVDSDLEAGTHMFYVDVSGLTPGAYFICGHAGSLRVSERTVLIR